MPPEMKLKSKQQQLMTSIFSTVARSHSSVSNSDRKWIITRQLALMCCEDLSPFEIVRKPGFVKFLKKNNVINHDDELPDPTTVSRSGLNTVYDESISAVKAIIKESPKTVGMTTDMWTDNYRRRSYMTVTLHFCSSDFCMQSIVLRTLVFTEAHTGDNIAKELKKILTQFGLEDKTVVYITDQGSNVVKACRVTGSERFGCAAHGLHNLIAVDGVIKGPDVQTIICKAKDVIKTFTFKTSLLESESDDMMNENLVAELERLLEDMDEDHHCNMYSLDSDCEEDTSHLGDIDSDDQRSREANSSGLHSITSMAVNTAAAPARPQFLTTLKKDCPTRWNCLLSMLESLLINQKLIERCLSRLRLFDKMFSDDEWEIIMNLVQFLRVFKTATEVLSGSKYPTISLVLLFRAEIVAAIADLPYDCVMVKSMKQRMRQALNHRLPITELNVVAALLDPSQRNLTSLQDFITAHETTAVELLSKALDKYVGVGGLQASPEAVGGQAPDGSPAPWKKAKNDLLSKHVTSASTQDREIQQFRCLSLAPDDVLAWWSTQKETYPKLSMLARMIMAIPATSAPSERIFSTAGLTVNAKRSSLAPSTVDKIVFVHENAHFLNDRAD